MRARSLLLAFLLCVLAVAGTVACVGGDELNPQPLPPGDENGDPRNPATGGGSSSSGETPAPSQDPKDAGVDGDAGADG